MYLNDIDIGASCKQLKRVSTLSHFHIKIMIIFEPFLYFNHIKCVIGDLVLMFLLVGQGLFTQFLLMCKKQNIISLMFAILHWRDFDIRTKMAFRKVSLLSTDIEEIESYMNSKLEV